MRRVVFDGNFGPFIGVFPDGADRSWLNTKAFEVAFMHWLRRLKDRRDVFLGYCGSSSGTAENLIRLLENDIGATVLDWQRDFRPGRFILAEIEEACAGCTAGIFLFTKDDQLGWGNLWSSLWPGLPTRTEGRPQGQCRFRGRLLC